MSAERSIWSRLNNFETTVCEILLSLFVLLLFAQIVARQVFGFSIAWSEELSTYMFVWFAYLGAVVAAKMSAHNRVTFHFQYMPKWLAKTLAHDCRPALGRASTCTSSGSATTSCSTA